MNGSEYKPLTIGNWIVTLIILAIPLVNIIMLVVWSASESTHPSKRSYAQANLVILGVVFCIAILAALILPLFAHFAGSAR